jgi:hypothetical protein
MYVISALTALPQGGLGHEELKQDALNDWMSLSIQKPVLPVRTE